MDAREFEKVLLELFTDQATDDDGHAELEGFKVTSFTQGGYLTRDRGVVVRLSDGAEFQVTVVQARLPHGEDD